MIKRCEHCHRHGGRISSNRLCEDCKARGWRWCSIGKHTVRACDYVSSRYGCHECRRQDALARWHARTGKPIAPPPGYVRLVEAAPAYGYTPTHLRGLLLAGRLDGWQRTRGGAWYVRRPG